MSLDRRGPTAACSASRSCIIRAPHEGMFGNSTFALGITSSIVCVLIVLVFAFWEKLAGHAPSALENDCARLGVFGRQAMLLTASLSSTLSTSSISRSLTFRYSMLPILA